MMDVGFIGLGTMGRPMARHLQTAGHRLFLCDVGPISHELVAAGGVVCKSGKEVAEQPDVVIMMVCRIRRMCRRFCSARTALRKDSQKAGLSST